MTLLPSGLLRPLRRLQPAVCCVGDVEEKRGGGEESAPPSRATARHFLITTLLHISPPPWVRQSIQYSYQYIQPCIASLHHLYLHFLSERYQNNTAYCAEVLLIHLND